MTEYIIDTITIGDTEVHVICKENGDGTLSTFITSNLEDGQPVGLVVFVPGFNDYFIYFDEMNGPIILPNFGDNMYYYSLNWNQDNFTQNDPFLQDIFQNITEIARHTLNQLIDNHQHAVNDYLQGLNDVQDQEEQDQEVQDQEVQDQNYNINNDDINYDDNIIIQDDEQVYNEMINNEMINNVIQG